MLPDGPGLWGSSVPHVFFVPDLLTSPERCLWLRPYHWHVPACGYLSLAYVLRPVPLTTPLPIPQMPLPLCPDAPAAALCTQAERAHWGYTCLHSCWTQRTAPCCSLPCCPAVLCWPSPVLTPTPASRPELTQPHRSAGSHQGRAFSLSYWDPHKPVGSRPVLSFAVPREAASFLQCEVSPPLPWGSQPLCSLRNLLLIVITLLSSVSNCPFFTGSSASTLRCP